MHSGRGRGHGASHSKFCLRFYTHWCQTWSICAKHFRGSASAPIFVPPSLPFLLRFVHFFVLSCSFRMDDDILTAAFMPSPRPAVSWPVKSALFVAVALAFCIAVLRTWETFLRWREKSYKLYASSPLIFRVNLISDAFCSDQCVADTVSPTPTIARSMSPTLRCSVLERSPRKTRVHIQAPIPAPAGQ